MRLRRFAPSTALAFALALAGAGAEAAGPADLYYERSLMAAAGARCGLFDPAVSAALTSAARQARGAALRGGADPAALDQVEARARARAGATPCDAPDLATAAKRVRAAFAGWSRLTTMSFPGRFATWRADRIAGRAGTPGWRLQQTARAAEGPVTFGIVGDGRGGESLAATAAWPGALTAATARIVVRDPAKAPRPYLVPRRPALAAQAPPRSVARAFLASARTAAPPALVPAGAGVAALFRFPAVAAAAIEALDPREAIVLELVYPTATGERVEAVPFEAGDFAAARAFLAGAAP
jgi:hypothetical protein